MDERVIDIIAKAKEIALSAKKTAQEAAEAASQKAQDAYGITKLSVINIDLAADIEKLYKEIGKEVYREHCGKETDPETVAEKLLEIDEIKEKILDNKKKIEEIKTVNVCPECGKKCDKEDAFCASCGHKF